MKMIFIPLIMLFAFGRSLAQITPAASVALAIKYLNNQAGYYPRSLFITGITSEDDTKTTYGIKATALSDGFTGFVNVTSSDNRKLVSIKKEYATLADAKASMNDMIAAMQQAVPAIQPMANNVETASNSVEKKFFGVNLGETFSSMVEILKVSDTDYTLKVVLRK